MSEKQKNEAVMFEHARAQNSGYYACVIQANYVMLICRQMNVKVECLIFICPFYIILDD